MITRLIRVMTTMISIAAMDHTKRTMEGMETTMDMDSTRQAITTKKIIMSL